MASPNPEPLPMWLNPSYSRQIVKGNLMTLSARPKVVEQGEWIAHQVVENYRNLWNFVRVIHEKEEDGTSICNAISCPKMSAGPNHSYTWLNSRYQPVELPACEYMALMQRWIGSKANDERLFPTDPAGVSCAPCPPSPPVASGTANQSASHPQADLAAADNGGHWVGRRSGFPEEFANVSRTIFLQMLRVYAHLYHNHFVEPFYHLNLEKQLNSCFSHFLLTAASLDMLGKEDLEPVQGLLDLWAASGIFPQGSKAYQLANIANGNRILQLAAF
ncbi:maintenance of ploidy protein MOB2 [Sodiomyces alkalinus F11]|uniref:Maintenance of ploidy protein MOB2 n=1 Tax=Sodiomyces alkalinus (strain CBS 110278 / VKM F-3762 / F11) TaxID=1314773 RepID=A0A3N2Q506_SODAK|nr:maintenance of ploidy protein MOB2 [Sodiomyces alkalinus F11]ROT41842.1 maintenance of ploidy protein MOB2 [Sodiomyces alkalinus F11]